MSGCTLSVFSHTVSTSPPHPEQTQHSQSFVCKRNHDAPLQLTVAPKGSSLSVKILRQEPTRSRVSPSNPINILTCMCTPLSSRCRCCIWRSSTIETCSCTATPANTGACCSRGRSTLGRSHWCAASLSCCTPCRACPGSPLEGPPRSSWETCQCTPGPYPWASGKSRASWSWGI